MAHTWRGVIAEYADRLPVGPGTPVVSLGEGGTPLVRADHLSELTGCDVHLKVEGANPTGSFKDRGMTVAISKAVEEGATAVICASTGNTSASAAAYAVKAGLSTASCWCRTAGSRPASSRRRWCTAPGCCRSRAASTTACGWPATSPTSYPVSLVNSVNAFRIEGQKTASFEVVDALGRAPDVHCLPVGNAGNITAYWKGYIEYADDGLCDAPRMWGFQAEGAAPIVRGERVDDAGDRRDRDPHRRPGVLGRRRGGPRRVRRPDRRGHRPSDPRRAAAAVGSQEGVFVEPASAASVAGLLQCHEQGLLDPGLLVVCTVTGNGLKDTETALREISIDTDDGPGRRPRRRRRARPATGMSSSVAAVTVRVPGDQRQPRPRLRLPRARPRPARRGRGDRGRPGRRRQVEVHGARRGRRRGALRRRAPRRARDARARWTRSASRTRRSRCTCTNTIPHGRGLGSSAAAVVAGLLAGRALVADGVGPARTTTRCWRSPSAFEGHPDNAAAACSAASPSPGPTPTARARGPPRPPPGRCAPRSWSRSTELSTETARGLLPATVPHADAAHAAGRAALLVAALTAVPP